jgi:nucleotide-binding universal stress UspA family protein
MGKFIVVGVDETPESQIALRWAVEAARSRGTAVRVIRAYANQANQWPAIGAEGFVTTPSIDRYQAELDAAVEYVRDRLGYHAGSGWLASASPAEAILVEGERAEMIVLGTRNRNRLEAAILGSVVTAVTARATCPVAVVTSEEHDGPIVVGTDGSSHSDDALAFAFEEADRTGRALTVVYCWNPTDRHDRPAAQAHELLHDWLADSLEPYEQKYPRVHVRSKVIENRPAVALAAMTEGASLAVGSRGRGGVRGLLLGSVSQSLLHHANCPVVIVHQPHNRT